MKIDPGVSEIDKLKWAVKHRAENQQCAIGLYELLTKHRAKITQRNLQPLAQALVGITFSLWRAAFLADKKPKWDLTIDAASGFLLILIEDNSIGYPQDKKHRNWTFNYYTNNVRATFLDITSMARFTHLVPKWQKKDRNPQERWEYGQELLARAVGNLEAELKT